MRGETAASRVLPTTTLPPFPPHFQLFNDAIRLAVAYKESSQDFMDEVLQELENFKLEQKEEDTPGQEQGDMSKSPSPS